MPSYAILQNPGHNRVYFQSARALARQELRYLGRRLSAPPLNPREAILGGVPYLCFDAESALNEADIRLLSRLSFAYALFELEPDALRPLTKDPAYYFESDDISTILKYTGKTNELFTRLMLNLSLCNTAPGDEITVLDPLCGKGTTLFEALLCGHHACGVEADAKMIQEANLFLRKYLERLRHKHSTHTQRIGLPQNAAAQRYQITLTRGKGETPLRAEFIAGDTRQTDSFYRKNTFDAIVGDLPYGVQHGGKTEGKSRNALPLLQEALPAWRKVLKPGGTVVLAWNLFLITRAEMKAALLDGGFTADEDVEETGFVHRVDQAIERDLIIARKKG